MATKRVTITLNDQPVELVLRSSSVEDGLLRGQIMAKAYARKDEEGMTQELRIAGTILHPVCVACVREPRSVRELSLEEFFQLDEQEVNAWANAAYELNPHWKIQVDIPSDEAEKKIGTPSSGSPASTSPETMQPSEISQPSATSISTS